MTDTKYKIVESNPEHPGPWFYMGISAIDIFDQYCPHKIFEDLDECTQEFDKDQGNSKFILKFKIPDKVKWNLQLEAKYGKR